MNKIAQSSIESYPVPVATRKASRGWGGRRPGAGRKPVLHDPVTVTTDVESTDFEVLEAIAQERNTTVASLVRAAVAAYVKRYRRK